MNEARHLESLSDSELTEVIWETQESNLIENFEALKVIWERAFEADDVESALAWSKRMQEVARKLDSPVREALALHYMGMVQHILNNFDDAISCLYQSEKIYGINLYFEEQCRVDLQLAEVFNTTEDYLAKLSTLEFAREIAIREELVSLAGQACMEIAMSMHYELNSLSQGFNEENSAFAFEMHAIREIIENPVPRPRSAGQMLTPEFLAVKHRLDELIHGPVAEQEEEKLPVIKLTDAGDEVE